MPANYFSSRGWKLLFVGAVRFALKSFDFLVPYVLEIGVCFAEEAYFILEWDFSGIILSFEERCNVYASFLCDFFK